MFIYLLLIYYGTQMMNVWGNNEFEVEPVSGALCQIGLPAIRALLSRIEETDDAKIARKCVQICDNIEGPEMTKIRLEDLLKMNDEKRKRARIESALADEEEMEANLTNKLYHSHPNQLRQLCHTAG